MTEVQHEAPDAGPARTWRALRWTFPFVGASLLFGAFLAYERYVEPLYDGFAPEGNLLQWPLVAALVVASSAIILRVTRLRVRAHLLAACALQVLGAIGLFVLWMALLGLLAAGH